MSTQPRIDIYSDPLRRNGKQAVIVAQLFCATCKRDLSAPRTPGIIDIQTGHAYCSAEHWQQRER